MTYPSGRGKGFLRLAENFQKMFVVLVQIANGFNNVIRKSYPLQSFKNEIPRKRGEGGGEVEERNGRVFVALKSMGNCRFLNVNDVLDNVSTSNETALTSMGVVREMTVNNRSKAGRENFSVAICAAKRTGLFNFAHAIIDVIVLAALW